MARRNTQRNVCCRSRRYTGPAVMTSLHVLGRAYPKRIKELNGDRFLRRPERNFRPTSGRSVSARARNGGAATVPYPCRRRRTRREQPSSTRSP